MLNGDLLDGIKGFQFCAHVLVFVCVRTRVELGATFWKNHKGKAKQKEGQRRRKRRRSTAQCLMSRCREVRVESGMKTPRNQIN